MTSARLAAARVLLAQDDGRTTLAAAIDRERSAIDDARDRALFMEIAVGTVRWRAELDACLAAAARRPVGHFAPEARATLRTAAYQLLHLERVPSHAVIHEAVDLARALGVPRAASFVNAVLRNLQRARQAGRLALPARPDRTAEPTQALDYLSVTLSHPRWLVARWLRRYGFEATERWCQFNNMPPGVTVRVPPGDEAIGAALREHGLDATPSPLVPGAWRLPPGALGRLPADVRARVFVQDEAAQMVAHAAGVTSGDRVLDLCAAPGGKTMILREAAGAEGFVVASDYRASRVALLRRTLTAAGVSGPVLALDATRPLPFDAVFDRVVLDAPCSGLGTLRRDPDLKWSRVEADLPRLAETAHLMLQQAAEAVAPGGALLYATCSPEPEENEDVVARFLAARRDFTRSGDDLRTCPFRDSLDAFFAALLVRSQPA